MLYVLPDTNVLLHGKPLKERPWKDIADDDEIILAIAAPVVRELDRHKNKSGPLGRRARTLSGEVRELLKLPGREQVVQEGPPKVRLKILSGLDNRDPLHPSLDLQNEDHALINMGLAILRDGDLAMLLTDDTFAAIVADEVGLAHHMLPADWRRPDEPDEIELKAKRDIAAAERVLKQEPSVKLLFLDLHDKPIDRIAAISRVHRPLTDAEVRDLKARIYELHPLVTDFGDRERKERTPEIFKGVDLSGLRRSLLSEIYIPPTDEEIAAYKKSYEKWIEGAEQYLRSLHAKANKATAWPQVWLAASNEGTRPAQALLVEIEASGGLYLWKARDRDIDEAKPEVLALKRPPSAPKGSWRPVSLANLDALYRDFAGLGGFGLGQPLRQPFLDHLRPPAPRKPDAFYWHDHDEGASSRWSLTCESWRHQADPELFHLPIRANLDHGIVRGAITATVHAANLTKPVRATLPVEIEREDGDIIELARTLVEGPKVAEESE